MSSFELIDHTVSLINTTRSFFEQSVLDLENAFRDGNCEIACLDSKIVIHRNPVDLDFLKVLGPWTELFLLEYKASGNMKTLVSIAHLAMKDTLLLPFLIRTLDAKNTGLEGMAYDTQTLFKIHYKHNQMTPEKLLNLEGIIELYENRFDKEEGEIEVEIEVEYTKTDLTWIAGNVPPGIRKYNTKRGWNSLIVLKMRIVFPPSSPKQFMNFPINPMDGRWQVSSEYDQIRLSPTTETVLRYFQCVESVENRGIAVSGSPEGYLPGAYDGFEIIENSTSNLKLSGMNLSKERYLVDTVDIENALVYIFQKNDEYGQSTDEKSYNTEKLIELLRFKDVMVPKNSILWKLAFRLFDSASLNPRHLAFEVSPYALLRGLWPEFLRQIRALWDQLEYIPNVSTENIEREYNSLHQQLCMINCCIRKKLNNNLRSNSMFDAGFTPHSYKSESSWEKVTPIGSHGRFSSADLPSQAKLNHNADSLPKIIIPETQIPCPMTEEMFAQNDLILQSFGTDEEGQKSRLRYQSAHLISDMSSFKANNQFASFEDFVYWYSPKDWSLGEDGRGQLSSRFSGENCSFWYDLWLEAIPIPANKQKQLFDPEKESAKAFDILDNYSEVEILNQLKSVAVIIAYDNIRNLSFGENTSQKALFDSVCSKLLQILTRCSSMLPGDIHELLPEYRNFECKTYLNMFLTNNLGISPGFARGLVQTKQEWCYDEFDKVKLLECLKSGANELPAPTTKQYLMKRYHSDCKMLVRVGDKGLQIAEAFSIF